MIMIGQYTPSENIGARGFASAEYLTFEFAHPLRVLTDYVFMFETSSRDYERHGADKVEVRGPVPWKLSRFSFF